MPFTGYVVKKKGLFYYKANKVGIKINRSAKLMHDKFKEYLQIYTIDPIHVEPLKKQLHYTWENLTEQSNSEKKVISLKLNEVDQDFYNMRKQYAIGKLIEAVYLEFSAELSASKTKLLEELQKLNDRLSNPAELIQDTCYMAANLHSV